MILAPFQSPALFFFELQYASTLGIDFKNVQDSSYINQSKSSLIAIDSYQHRERLPKQFGLLSYVRQSESPQSSTLSTNDKHLLAHSYSADYVFTFLCVIELVHIINGISIWLLLYIPAYLSSNFSIAYLPSRLKHSQP